MYQCPSGAIFIFIDFDGYCGAGIVWYQCPSGAIFIFISPSLPSHTFQSVSMPIRGNIHFHRLKNDKKGENNGYQCPSGAIFIFMEEGLLWLRRDRRYQCPSGAIFIFIEQRLWTLQIQECCINAHQGQYSFSSVRQYNKSWHKRLVSMPIRGNIHFH